MLSPRKLWARIVRRIFVRILTPQQIREYVESCVPFFDQRMGLPWDEEGSTPLTGPASFGGVPSPGVFETTGIQEWPARGSTPLADIEAGIAAVREAAPEPVEITSMDQLRELYGEGSSLLAPYMRWIDAAATIRACGAQLGRSAMDAHARAIMQYEADAGTFDGAEADLAVDHGPGWRPEDEEWTPPGEAEGLPPWVEKQIPEPCPECGLSQLGALTIRRTPVPEAGGIELNPFGRPVAVHFPAPRVVSFTVAFKCPGIRLVKAMEDYAGKWPAQRKER